MGLSIRVVLIGIAVFSGNEELRNAEAKDGGKEVWSLINFLVGMTKCVFLQLNILIIVEHGLTVGGCDKVSLVGF